MQITTSSSEKMVPGEHQESTGPVQCPVCSGSLVLLHRSYRCSRCCFALCAGCESIEPETLDYPY